MKHASPLVLIPLLFLAACASNTASSGVTLDENLKNPLFAQRYYEDLTEQMVTLELRNDPLLKDASKKAIIERTRTQSTKHAQDALALRQTGLNGTMQSDKDLALGSVTLVNDTLFFGTDFIATPGPSLHVYVSSLVDPRSERFPDSSAVDLGVLHSAYGAQAFALPKTSPQTTYRSVALRDDALGTIYGFAQLAGQ